MLAGVGTAEAWKIVVGPPPQGLRLRGKTTVLRRRGDVRWDPYTAPWDSYTRTQCRDLGMWERKWNLGHTVKTGLPKNEAE